MFVIKTRYKVCMYIYIYIINGKSFAGLNFHGFCSFQEYRESFSVNISAFLQVTVKRLWAFHNMKPCNQ